MKAREDSIPWRAIAGIGNVLRLDCHRSYPTILWETCQKELDPLKEAIYRIKRAIQGM
ncbi:HepT-like ribonuclease domain-containing protein [Fodinicurvata halophila]|uniref:HepT-like ribonuclease domain-containing protein n=1 Tax=Fodinicurvata halophila TaxID=1419723 RepID=A0ABV8UKE6_9PROT